MSNLIDKFDTLIKQINLIETNYVSKVEMEKIFQMMMNCCMAISPEIFSTFENSQTYMDESLSTFQDKFYFKFNNQIRLIDSIANKVLKTQAQIDKMNVVLSQKVSKSELLDEVNSRFKSMQERQTQELEEYNEKVTTSMNQQKIVCSNLQNQLLTLEKDTLWKIKECERLLLSRVTKEYVQQINQELVAYIQDKSQDATGTMFSQLQQQINSLQLEMNSSNDTNIRSIKAIKEENVKITQKITNSLVSNEKMEIIKQNIYERISELNSKVFQHQNKLEQLMNMDDVLKDILKHDMEITNINKKISGITTSVTTSESKIQQYQQVISKAENDLKEFEHIQMLVTQFQGNLDDFKQQFKRDEQNRQQQLSEFYDKIMLQLALFKKETMKDRVEKGDIISLFEKEICQPHSILAARIQSISQNLLHISNGQTLNQFVNSISKEMTSVQTRLNNHLDKWQQFQQANLLTKDPKIIENKISEIKDGISKKSSAMNNRTILSSMDLQVPRERAFSSQTNRRNMIPLNQIYLKK